MFSAGAQVYFPEQQQNFIDLYCLTCFYMLCSCIRCSFEQNARKLIVCLRHISDNNNFLYFFFIFDNIFLSTHNVGTLPFSVQIRPGSYECCRILLSNKIEHRHEVGSRVSLSFINPLSTNPTYGQTHTNNLSAKANKLFECV